MKSLIKKPKFGASCVFVRLSSEVGLKFYSSKSERNFAYRLQQRAAKLGIGPLVYGKVDLADGIEIRIKKIGYWCDKFIQYGYLTQIAKQKRVSYAAFNTLGRKMRKHGFCTADVCDANVGFIGKKLVCIDFDMGSM